MKNILVTGATRGLGLAITEQLATEGFHVIATGRAQTDGLRRLMDLQPDHISFVALDLAETEAIQPFVQELKQRFGPIFGLVNNAAIGVDGVLGTMHNSDIERILRVNTLAPIILTKYVVRGMMARREGRVVSISSIIASTGFSGLSVYASSKSSLEGFSRSLAREVGRFNITVNTVAPGYMDTEMTAGLQDAKLGTIVRRSPLGRLATTQDAAGAVAYLLGKSGASVTGTTLTVDAGSTC